MIGDWRAIIWINEYLKVFFYVHQNIQSQAIKSDTLVRFDRHLEPHFTSQYIQ